VEGPDSIEDGLAREELRRLLAGMEEPPEALFEEFDYLRGTFRAAIRRAADFARRPTSKEVDASFSLAGELLRYAADRMRRLFPRGEGLVPLPGVRSIDAPPRPAGDAPAVARVVRDCGGDRIEVTTRRSDDGTEIEFDLLRTEDGAEIRPFEVVVTDTGGARLTEPLRVERNQRAPSFPGPRAGIYVFDLSWAEGSVTIRIEFA